MNTENFEFSNLKTNYFRLKRHYEVNLLDYDEISLLDLSNTLRIWTEMAEIVDSYLARASIDKVIKFPSYDLSKKLKRYIVGREYIIAGTCGGVRTSSKNENLIMPAPENSGDKISKSFNFMIHNDGRIEIKDIAIVHTEVRDSNQAKEFNALLKNGFTIRKSIYSHWLTCEAVRTQYSNDVGDYEIRKIPRNILVKRISNILGGSHAISNDYSDRYYDTAVYKLMNTIIGGLPIPYFLLLKIAQDILDGIHMPD